MLPASAWAVLCPVFRTTPTWQDREPGSRTRESKKEQSRYIVNGGLTKSGPIHASGDRSGRPARFHSPSSGKRIRADMRPFRVWREGRFTGLPATASYDVTAGTSSASATLSSASAGTLANCLRFRGASRLTVMKPPVASSSAAPNRSIT